MRDAAVAETGAGARKKFMEATKIIFLHRMVV
jgi:hypothetical protein